MADRSQTYRSPMSYSEKVKARRANGSEVWLDKKTANSPHVKSLGITVTADEMPEYVRKFEPILPKEEAKAEPKEEAKATKATTKKSKDAN